MIELATKRALRLLMPALIGLAALCALPAPGEAQVVVVVNGSPITELDIAQRTKLTSVTTNKTPGRQDVIKELIDDRLKISKAKYYGFEIPDADIESSFETMARRQRMTPQQFSALLERSGVSPAALKARIRAEITWNQLVRGKYTSSLQVGDSDVAVAMRSRNEPDKPAVGYFYTLYPVMIVLSQGSTDGTIASKMREAEQLRARFKSCKDGIALARALRDVAVREPITRSSADLSPQLQELLGKMEIGQLTIPEVTPQGLQMFALCGKKESTADSSAKRELREEIFMKRFEAESKRFLEEIRRSAMIEYKK